MSDIDHTRDCILPSDGKAEGLVRASELFALAAERDALRAALSTARADALEEAARVVTEHYETLCAEHRLLLVNRAAAIRAIKEKLNE